MCIRDRLHDIDFEQYPEEHCLKAPELLKAGGAEDELIHAVCSHAYGIMVDVKPEHTMEKVLFAADELTGLIGAAARKMCIRDRAAPPGRRKFADSSGR